MRILIAQKHHQHPGEENAVIRDEFGLLKDFGKEEKSI